MEMILSPYSASISELKKNPTALLKKADGSSVAILNHNRVVAYLVPIDAYRAMIDIVEDYELGKLVKEREAEEATSFEVNINDL